MVFNVVMDVVGLWLSDGYRVETPIGSFAPKLKLLGDHPRLWKVRESRRWLYFPKREASKD